MTGVQTCALPISLALGSYAKASEDLAAQRGIDVARPIEVDRRLLLRALGEAGPAALAEPAKIEREDVKALSRRSGGQLLLMTAGVFAPILAVLLTVPGRVRA